MNLNNLKIGRRLALGFGALLALMGLLFGVALSQLFAAQKDGRAAQEYEHQAAIVAEWTSLTELNVTRTVAIAKSAGQPAVDAYFEPLMKSTSAKISELQKDLESLITSEAGKAQIAEIGPEAQGLPRGAHASSMSASRRPTRFAAG